MIIPVAVEKLDFSEKSHKSGDGKCPGHWGKSFVELPDAIEFFKIPSERVFQQPPLFSTPIRKNIAIASQDGRSTTGDSSREDHRLRYVISYLESVALRVEIGKHVLAV